MADDIILGPDVFVNASVALGSPPEHVIRRVLQPGKKTKSTEWIVQRIEAMLHNVESFKKDAIDRQMKTILQFLDLVDDDEHGPDAWTEALVAAAKAAVAPAAGRAAKAAMARAVVGSVARLG